MATYSFNMTCKPMAMALVLVFMMTVMMGPSTGELELPRCNTSKRSPALVDAQKCVQHVRNMSQCCRGKPSAPPRPPPPPSPSPSPPPPPAANCSVLAKVGSAEALLCGGRKNNSCVNCTTAANALHAIVKTCGRDINGTRRVSGSDEFSSFTFRIQPSHRAELGDDEPEVHEDGAELVEEEPELRNDGSEVVEEEPEEREEEDLPPFMPIITSALLK